jgi:hypothetical protein
MGESDHWRFFRSSKLFAEEGKMISGIMTRIRAQAVAALILAVGFMSVTTSPAIAGAVGGARYGFYKLPGEMMDSMNVTFWGNETAEVGVIGDGFTNLDLYVYDSFGNLVATDENPTDLCYVRWVPRSTMIYTLKVVNRGSIYNEYKIVTN